MRAERDILAQATERNPWVTELVYSFQNADHLFLIMEFVPGGDLMAKLVKYDTFSLDITRFYIAEILLAVHNVHLMNFIHRFVLVWQLALLPPQRALAHPLLLSLTVTSSPTIF